MVSIFVWDKDKDTFNPYAKTHVDIETVHSLLISDQLKQRTLDCWGALSNNENELYNNLKHRLPAPTFSGKFEHRKNEKLLSHSGRVCLDFDGLKQREHLLSLREKLCANPHVELLFISPSNQGIKAIVKISPIPSDMTEHRTAFTWLKKEFDKVHEVDKSGSNVSRLCFLCWDKTAYYNPNAVPFEVDLSKEFRAANTKAIFHGKTDDTEVSKALSVIPNNVPYDEWLAIGMALKNAGMPLSIWQNWCNNKRYSQSRQSWKNEDLEYKWNSFTRQEVSINTLFYIAKKYGYKTEKYSRNNDSRSKYRRYGKGYRSYSHISNKGAI